MCLRVFSFTQHGTKNDGYNGSYDKLSQYVMLLCLLLIDANPLNAAMSPTQSPSVRSHSIHLNQFERSVVKCMDKHPDGTWSCKLCKTEFDNNIMRLITHLLTLCDQPPSLHTFSTISAIRICIVLDDSETIEMLETYIRVAGDDNEIEGSDLSDDTESEVHGFSDDTISDMSDLDKVEQDENTGPGKDRESESSQAPKGSREAKSPQLPENQVFSAAPPASLSVDEQAEWTFKRDRKYFPFSLPLATTKDHALTS